MDNSFAEVFLLAFNLYIIVFLILYEYVMARIIKETVSEDLFKRL